MKEKLAELKTLRDQIGKANILQKAAIAEQATVLAFDLIDELVKRVEKLERGHAPQSEVTT